MKRLACGDVSCVGLVLALGSMACGAKPAEDCGSECAAESSSGGSESGDDTSPGSSGSSSADDGASSGESESSSSGDDGGDPIGFECGDPLWLTVAEPGEYIGVSLGAADSFVAWGADTSHAQWVRYGSDGTAGTSAKYPGPMHATMIGAGVDGSDRVLALVDEFVEFVPGDELEGTYLRHKWLGSFAADASEEWTVDFGTDPDVEFAVWDAVVADDGTAIVAGSLGGDATHLRAFDPSGAVLWDADWPGMLWLRTVDDEGVVVALEQQERAVGIGVDGSEAWSVALDVVNAFDADAAGDSVYVAGQGDQSLYVARIGKDGTVAWENTEPVHDGYDAATAIAVGPDGRVAVVGSMQQTGRFPAWMRILSADGTILRTDECAVDDGEDSTDTRLNDVAFDASGNVFAVGSADVDDSYHAVAVAWTP